MGIKRFKMPDPGEGLVEAEIITWKVKPGDAVKVNDIVVEIETAKSLVELPIPWAGTIAELLVPEGKTVDVGTEIITVDVAGEADDAPAGSGASAGSDCMSAQVAATAEAREPNLVGYGAVSGSTTRRARKTSVPAVPAPAPAAAPADQMQAMAEVGAAASAPVARTHAPAAEPTSAPRSSAPGGRPLAKPPVRKFAKDQGIDLALVPGSGKDGIITRADVEAYLAGGPAAATSSAPVYAQGEREVRIPIKGVRKMTAQAMVGSKFTAPHVTEFITLDCSAMMDLVARLKKDREFKDVKVTPLLIVAKAVLLASKRNPGINAFWDEAAQEIVQKNYVNLGIAASTPRGLIVPNIKDADRMTLVELAEAMGALVATAREGRTPPSDMAGGTFTITNVGVFGVDTGTPIINPGESAILAFGAVRRQPWVVEDEFGNEEIVPRWITQLSLSFDHRLIDGDLGSRFLADVAAVLADPAKGLLWG